MADTENRNAVPELFTGWQPIETAPKDREIVLGRQNEVWLGTWHEGNGAPSGKYGESGWLPEYAPGDWWNYIQRPDFPTHWMPLPSPPEGV